MHINKLNYLILLFLTAHCSWTQTTYYVDQQNGNDSNNGTSVANAFETFDEAESIVSPGDTIEIIGVYANQSYNPNYTIGVVDDAHLWNGENTIRINGLNGTPGNYITIKPHDSNTILKGDGANILRIVDSSYLIIEAFNIQGEVDNIPISTANALQFVYIVNDVNLQGSVTNPNITDIRYRNEDETNDNDNIVEETDTYTDISNLNVVRPSYIDTRGLYVTRCNNLIIVNNTIYNTPGGGLRVAESSHVDIIGNEIYRCSAKSYSGTHALVVTKTEPIATNDYSVRVLKNKIHHNYNEQFSWAPDKTIITPRIDEGKGISLQRNNTSNWINGTGRILVENNLCYWNGFSGVHTNDGYRIDFINNTCYLNSFTNTITYPNEFPAEGQQGNNIGISAQSSNDIKMINNISVVDTDWNGFALSAGGTSNLVVSENMIFGYNGSVNQDSDITSVDVNTSIANPLFVDADNFDFNLQPSSPAIGIANSSFAPSDDFYSFIRDANPDLGAVEYNPSLSSSDMVSIEVAVFPNPFKDKIQVTTSNSVEDIRLFSITGQRINISNQITRTNRVYTISTIDLASGLYILKLDSENFKVIKQ